MIVINIIYSIIMYVCMYTYVCLIIIVIITIPPKNRTVHRGDDVTISCGYQWSTALPVTWIINGILFTEEEIVNSPLYQLNNPTIPPANSLTVFSINGTTTFRCIVHSDLNTTSTRGTMIVVGMYVCTHN